MRRKENNWGLTDLDKKKKFEKFSGLIKHQIV